MRVAITGCKGQLGRELISTAVHPAIEIFCTDVQEMDITSSDQINAVLSGFKPHAVINAAAYTQVDAAETERDLAFAINAAAPGLLAEWCSRSGACLVHVSTDYVFNGRKGAPYIETDAVDPLSLYGASKAEGEIRVRKHLARHFIVRTSWLYSTHGQNFVKTVLGLSRKQETLRIVSDQYGSPTSATNLAEAIWTIINRIESSPEDLWGTYHFCSRGVVSWYEFASEIVASLPAGPNGRRARVTPITTSEYPTQAERPAYSALDCSKFETTFEFGLSNWTDSLKPVVKALSLAVS